jgi:multidrug efflux pump subunit AcrB
VQRERHQAHHHREGGHQDRTQPDAARLDCGVECGEFDDIVVKVVDGRPVYVRDVGEVQDTAAIQTNVVRISRAPAWDSKRQVYIPIFRRPGSNTLEVVSGVNERIPQFLDQLPPKEGYTDPDTGKPASGLNLDVVADQSVFVRTAIRNLTWEGILGACLASLMVLIFIGSFRSTIVIALAIPLSALVAIVGLYFTGNTLNVMTLGGLALVMGRLVDDPLIDIENTFRHLDMGKHPKRAALDSAMEIAMPVLVATITTTVVFFPVIFLFGMGKYLFTPLALSVTIAMFASYFLSRTLSPAFCAYFLKAHDPNEKRFVLFRVADAMYDKVRAAYTGLLGAAVRRRWITVAGSLALVAASLPLYNQIGQELFPATDAGQIVMNVRAPSGTRIELTEELTQAIEQEIQAVIPAADRQMIVTDIGVLFDWPAGYTANAGQMDATMLVQLTEAGDRHVSSQEYARRLRERLNEKFPETSFAFNTGGMVQAALNFGLPAPINIQIGGRDMAEQYRIAQEIRDLIAEQVPGLVDVLGVLLILWATGTTFNVQSFMGVIFMIGIAVTNSILLVEFANRLREEQGLRDVLDHVRHVHHVIGVADRDVAGRNHQVVALDRLLHVHQRQPVRLQLIGVQIDVDSCEISAIGFRK